MDKEVENIVHGKFLNMGEREEKKRFKVESQKFVCQGHIAAFKEKKRCRKGVGVWLSFGNVVFKL